MRAPLYSSKQNKKSNKRKEIFFHEGRVKKIKLNICFVKKKIGMSSGFINQENL